MKKNVHFMECHTDVFHAGKNFGKKLHPKKTQGLSLQYDSDEKWFEITHNGRTGYIFSNNCAFWEPEGASPIPEPVNAHKTEDKSKRAKAQVSTPQSHVFSTGPGLK